ncbi:MAG TPA: acyl-CoA synthetase [Caulobacteraceae bacterium]|nr:acyl-CoA synthetase [Caulobacteraceae bacterium]
MAQIKFGDRAVDRAVVADRAARGATGLRAHGVERGDSIALMLRNDFPFLEATVAAGLVGAYVTPVNWHNTAEEAGYVLADCGAKVIVIHSDLLRKVQSGLPAGALVVQVPTPAEVAADYQVLPDDASPVPGVEIWADWLERFEPAVADESIAAPGSMIYTSGTTGRPKGVRRRPPQPEQTAGMQNMLNAVCGFAPWADKPEEIRVLLSGPIYHSTPNAWLGVFYNLGASIVVASRFDPEQMLRNVEQHQITHLLAVPTMFVRLLRLPDEVKRKYDLSSLKFVMHGAAPCPVHVKREMIAWWGPVIHEHYGGTETGAVTYLDSDEWLAHPGSVGRPLEHVRLMVLSESGEEIETGGTGEIVAWHEHYPDFTYHRDDAKRRRAQKQGLFSLGDVGYLDNDGYLYLCGRASDMIISGGVNIYPAEIEAEILKLPGVADAAVFGIPDDEFGEQVCAVIQPRPGFMLDAGQVRTDLRETLAGYKVPKVVEFSDTLPREDSGKIFKRKLREPYWENKGRSI